MNIKFILIILVGTALLFSCSNQKDSKSIINQDQVKDSTVIIKNDLSGSWEDESESALHFSLFADGIAQSDNMSTLLYQQWYVKGSELFLVAKSIGNKQKFIDTIAYTIQKLDNKELLLNRGDLVFRYKKVKSKSVQNQENISSSDQNIKHLKGQLVWGHETRTFKPCGSDKTFWISDETGKIKELYGELTNNIKPYSSIFVEIEIKDMGKAKEGFPANYEGVYNVVNVKQARKMEGKDCK